MTEICTGVFSTGKLFITNNSAGMFTEWIPCSTQFSICRTTNLNALVFFAGFQLVTDSGALEVVDLFYLVLSQE
jgi:hypothetical protein